MRSVLERYRVHSGNLSSVEGWQPCGGSATLREAECEFLKVGSVGVGGGGSMWHWYFSRAERGVGYGAMKQ